MKMHLKPLALGLVVILVSALGMSGCQYSRHFGRQGEDSQPLDRLGNQGVPRIEFGKSSAEELAGILRPTVMTVWFQPRKTAMGDMAGGYPLRVQIQPDGFADEKTPFPYGSPQAPKTSLLSLTPKPSPAQSSVTGKLGALQQNAQESILKAAPSSSDLKALTTNYLQKVFEQGHSNDPKLREFQLQQNQNLNENLNRNPKGSKLKVVPSGVDPKLTTAEYLRQIFNKEGKSRGLN